MESILFYTFEAFCLLGLYLILVAAGILSIEPLRKLVQGGGRIKTKTKTKAKIERKIMAMLFIENNWPKIMQKILFAFVVIAVINIFLQSKIFGLVLVFALIIIIPLVIQWYIDPDSIYHYIRNSLQNLYSREGDEEIKFLEGISKKQKYLNLFWQGRFIYDERQYKTQSGRWIELRNKNLVIYPLKDYEKRDGYYFQDSFSICIEFLHGTNYYKIECAYYIEKTTVFEKYIEYAGHWQPVEIKNFYTVNDETEWKLPKDVLSRNFQNPLLRDWEKNPPVVKKEAVSMMDGMTEEEKCKFYAYMKCK